MVCLLWELFKYSESVCERLRILGRFFIPNGQIPTDDLRNPAESMVVFCTIKLYLNRVKSERKVNDRKEIL